MDPSRQALTGQSPQIYEPVSSAHCIELAAVVNVVGDGRSSTFTDILSQSYVPVLKSRYHQTLHHRLLIQRSGHKYALA
jgi:hypothetical protein